MSKKAIITIVVAIVVVLAAVLGLLIQPKDEAKQSEKTVVIETVSPAQEEKAVKVVSVSSVPAEEHSFSDISRFFSGIGGLTDEDIKSGLDVYNKSIFKAEVKEEVTEAEIVGYRENARDWVILENGEFSELVFLDWEGRVNTARNVSFRKDGTGAYSLKLSNLDTGEPLYVYFFPDRVAVGIATQRMSFRVANGSSGGDAGGDSSGSSSGGGGSSEGPVGGVGA